MEVRSCSILGLKKKKYVYMRDSSRNNDLFNDLGKESQKSPIRKNK